MKSALVAQICAQSSNWRIWRPAACSPPNSRQWTDVSTQMLWQSEQFAMQSRISSQTWCGIVILLWVMTARPTWNEDLLAWTVAGWHLRSNGVC
jgi:hypothetical protein